MHYFSLFLWLGCLRFLNHLRGNQVFCISGGELNPWLMEDSLTPPTHRPLVNCRVFHRFLKAEGGIRKSGFSYPCMAGGCLVCHIVKYDVLYARL